MDVTHLCLGIDYGGVSVSLVLEQMVRLLIEMSRLQMVKKEWVRMMKCCSLRVEQEVAIDALLLKS
jgi:hypothetical protein